MIRDALSAAPPAVASTAKVVTMDNKVLKDGTDAYVCIPTEADKLAKGLREPMCLDKVWLSWADAWMNKKPFSRLSKAFQKSRCQSRLSDARLLYSLPLGN
jgi:hypothetical protein